MLYQLKSGKVVEITLEQFLDMTDEDWEYLEAYAGDRVEHPFYASTLYKVGSVEEEEDDTPDLTEASEDDKLSSLDTDLTNLEE